MECATQLECQTEGLFEAAVLGLAAFISATGLAHAFNLTMYTELLFQVQR